MTSAPRFILRRTTPEQQRLGGQFELASVEAPDKPFKVISMSSTSRSRLTTYEFETWEPLPGLKATRADIAHGGMARIWYRIPAADLVLEDWATEPAPCESR